MNHLFDLMQQILAAENGEVTIDIPESNFNFLMLKILREKARRENRTVHFKETGPRSRRLISFLEDGHFMEEHKQEQGREAVSTPAPRGKLRKLGLVLLLVIGVLGILGAAAFAAIYYLPTAEVILTLSPIPLVKEVPLKADISAQKVDGAAGVVPGTLQEVEESGTKTADATGTAIVGDKATGKITFAALNKSCDKGARFKEDDSGLIFLTVSAFDIPAGDNQEKDVISEKIGVQYNLDAGKNFTMLSGCSGEVLGIDSTAFEGGNSEEVTIATVADQSKLLTDLQKELVSKAKETIHAQSGIDEVVVDKAVKVEILTQTYSHEVGEQAETISLTLEIKLTTITYKGADIQEFISQALSTIIPAEFTLFPGETEVEALNPKLKEKQLTFTAKISAQVIYKIDEQKIKEDLAGRNPQSAQDYLSSLSEVTSFELKLWPNLPASLQRVPRNIERITVSLKTEEQ